MSPPPPFPFQQVFNFRDLGGHATGDGRRVRVRRPLSVGRPHGRNRGGHRVAGRATRRLRTLLDLRHAPERERFPMTRTWPGTRSAPAPLQSGRHAAPVSDARRGLRGRAQEASRRQAARRGAFAACARGRGSRRLLLFGAGKDRTGLVAAAILSSLGVPDEAVADDYARSADSLDSMFAAWARRPNSTAIEETLRNFPHVMGAPRNAMTQAAGRRCARTSGRCGDT